LQFAPEELFCEIEKNKGIVFFMMAHNSEDKVTGNMVDLNFNEFFEWSQHYGIRGHKYKLYKSLQVHGFGQNFSVNASLLYGMNCLSLLILAQLLVLKTVF